MRIGPCQHAAGDKHKKGSGVEEEQGLEQKRDGNDAATEV